MRNEEIKANEKMILIAGMCVGFMSSEEMKNKMIADGEHFEVLNDMTEVEFVDRMKNLSFNEMDDDMFISKEYQVSAFTNAIDVMSETLKVERNDAKITAMVGASYMAVKGSKNGMVSMDMVFEALNRKIEKPNEGGSIASYYRNKTNEYNK